MSGRTVYVTGSAGFIGRNLCAHLASEGLHVRRGVRQAGGHDWPAELDGCDALVHLAHPMGRPANEQLFEAARAGGVRRIVLMSSVKAMAESTTAGEVLTEELEPRPSTPYGQGKLEVEHQARAAARGGGYELVVLRPPLVHGPGARGGLAKLVGAVRRGLPLPLAGLVNARSLVGIDNLSGAVATCLGHGQAGGRTFLVADGPPVSTPELIELLAEAIGRPARLVPAPTKLLAAAGRALGRRDDLDRLLGSLAVDDAAIRRTLGWRSAVTLQDGLARMVRGL